jgi:hypothetical protein
MVIDRWRNIDNPHLVENPTHLNGHDFFEDAIFRAKEIMQERGWKTEITDTQEQCHEHLVLPALPVEVLEITLST